MCAYLALPGSSLLHPFPIFICIRFSPDIVKELKSTSLNYIEAANIRYLCNTTSYDKLDNQVKSLLLTSTDNTSTPPVSEPYPAKDPNNNNPPNPNIQACPM